ncbi:hypothetical protein C7972_103106 [Arenibacter sp. ARW7G5Y1]|nr:hypothetical protein C7972_103106 [Arenibacter sp. ARW7G5Y1]
MIPIAFLKKSNFISQKKLVMAFLSPQIEALAKRKKEQSLVKKTDSCGIFQEYGKLEKIQNPQDSK